MAQNLFVANMNENTIYEFTPTGNQSVFASGLHHPLGIAFDRGGNLYEADAASGTINKFTPGGGRSTFASGLEWVVALAIDSSGDLFAADAQADCIYEFTPGGTRSTFASGLAPTGLAFDSQGDLFASAGSSVYEFAPNGGQLVFASGLNGPQGLAFDGSGNLFVANEGASTIIEITPAGQESFFGNLYGGCLAFDAKGNLFASAFQGYVYEFTPAGSQSTFATVPTEGPYGLALAPAAESGDANGDGRVDVNDLAIVLTNFGSTGRSWSQGCMDGDPTGTVDVNDLTIVLANFGTTYTAGALGAVPEPASVLLVAAGLASVLAYAWRKTEVNRRECPCWTDGGSDASHAAIRH
jgi:sugar lactone lactonase YvrE